MIFFHDPLIRLHDFAIYEYRVSLKIVQGRNSNYTSNFKVQKFEFFM